MISYRRRQTTAVCRLVAEVREIQCSLYDNSTSHRVWPTTSNSTANRFCVCTTSAPGKNQGINETAKDYISNVTCKHISCQIWTKTCSYMPLYAIIHGLKPAPHYSHVLQAKIPVLIKAAADVMTSADPTVSLVLHKLKISNEQQAKSLYIEVLNLLLILSRVLSFIFILSSHG